MRFSPLVLFTTILFKLPQKGWEMEYRLDDNYNAANDDNDDNDDDDGDEPGD